MMKPIPKLILAIFLFNTLTLVYAQETRLFIPREMKQAYDKGTRSYDGTPGKYYWQNSANYRIEAEIIPEKSLLRGEETITYFNNSPDTLTSIVFQLFQDLYKKGNPRKRLIDPSDVTNGTSIAVLQVNNNAVDLNDYKKVTRQNGLLKIELDKHLYPGESSKIFIKWSYHIPEKTFIRTARFDSTSFFIAYWFPRLAVYDDVFGWDKYGYNGMAEFNNDYADFNVTLKAPDNYLIWSSGELMNSSQVYTTEIIEKLNELKESDKVIRISKGVHKDRDSRNTKEWIYSAKSTKDFAFGFSDHHYWDAIRFKIEDGSEKQVNMVYHPDAKAYFEVLLIHLKKCLTFFSDTLPGINYPHKEFTAFHGYSKKSPNAIEFPAIVNCSYSLNDTINFSLLAHEMAHNYFPFHVNINESQFMWWEEGLTTYFEFVINRDLNKMERIDAWEKKNYMDFNSGFYNDIPPFTSSIFYERFMGLQTLYYRPGYAFITLEDLLGKDLFKKCMKMFINRWQGKRPIPHDMFNTFNDISGMNLNWFWKPWLFEFGYPDLAIHEVNENKISIKKVGILPVPVFLKIYYKNSSVQTIYQTAQVWKDGNEYVEIISDNSKEIDKITLSEKFEIPDIDRTNNIYISE